MYSSTIDHVLGFRTRERDPDKRSSLLLDQSWRSSAAHLRTTPYRHRGVFFDNTALVV
jgi:hypothetical protein